jgi:hypothetical protein
MENSSSVDIQKASQCLIQKVFDMVFRKDLWRIDHSVENQFKSFCQKNLRFQVCLDEFLYYVNSIEIVLSTSIDLLNPNDLKTSAERNSFAHILVIKELEKFESSNGLLSH